jgi:hypothetical protein
MRISRGFGRLCASLRGVAHLLASRVSPYKIKRPMFHEKARDQIRFIARGLGGLSP